MKIKRINTAFLLLALAGLTLTACSNEDIANVTPQEEGAGNVSFSIVEKDYEPADNTPKSRAAIEETKPEIQDLGDGLMAEVSLVPDTTHRADVPKTRAINTPTHYTIQAFQGGVKKGELKGTFNGSTFTPDAGQPEAIALPHGTYDFVCFNDGVTANGTQLTVNRADAGTARFDVQRNVLINQDPKQQVKFTMKHAGAAIRIYASYVNFSMPCKMTNTTFVDKWDGKTLFRKGEFIVSTDKYKYMVETPANAIPETMVYDLTTYTYTYPTMGQLSTPGEVDGQSFPATIMSAGTVFGTASGEILQDYLLPTTDCSKLKVRFVSGAPMGCNLTGKSIVAPMHKLLEANKQYLMFIRLYITSQYLFSDGTVGSLDKNPTKTPIGVVFNLNRNTTDASIGGSAFALHDVNEGGLEQIQWENTTAQETYNPYTSYSDLLAYTQDFPLNLAIQSAVDYTPLFRSNHWKMPGVRDFLLSGVSLGKMVDSWEAYKNYVNAGGLAYFFPSNATDFTPAPSTINFPSMNMTLFNQAFINANGKPLSGTYWTAAECKDGTDYKQATFSISGGKLHLDLTPKTSTAKVRPVIHF